MPLTGPSRQPQAVRSRWTGVRGSAPEHPQSVGRSLDQDGDDLWATLGPRKGGAFDPEAGTVGDASGSWPAVQGRRPVRGQLTAMVPPAQVRDS
jgi:hypothetical protein